MKKINNRFLAWYTIITCVIGIGFRAASFSWNNTLNGDVNLFALTAREFALHGRLNYPMKYEFSDRVEYHTLQTPASQHPPLWPFLAGLLSKISAIDDTFLILKILSEISGLCLIGVIAYVGNKFFSESVTSYDSSGTTTGLVAISLVSLSAVLIDFSANGSLYSLIALWLLLGSWLLLRFQPQKFNHIFYAGTLCAISILTHTGLLLLPLVFIYRILTDKSPQAQNFKFGIIKSRWVQMVLLLMVILLELSPWLIWNMRQFGTLFHSYSSHYIFDQLGLLHTGIYGDVISSRLDFSLPITQIIQRYFLLTSKSLYALCREFFLLVGPFGLFLLGVGLVTGIRKIKTNIISLLLPYLFYAAVIVLWATYKFRFLTPFVPVICLLAALGFVEIINRSKAWRWIAGLCLAGTIVWFLFPIFQNSKTLYYGKESQNHRALYENMQPIAVSLATRDYGVVLGFSHYLDGGIETVYWHRLPFVAGRGMGEMEIKKLASDFDIRYIWADNTTICLLQQWFPSAKMIDQSGEFAILELLN